MPSKDDPGPGRFLTSGLEVAAGVGLGLAVGNWIDRHFHCDPWGVILGLVVGFAAGVYLLIKDALKSNKN